MSHRATNDLVVHIQGIGQASQSDGEERGLLHCMDPSIVCVHDGLIFVGQFHAAPPGEAVHSGHDGIPILHEEIHAAIGRHGTDLREVLFAYAKVRSRLVREQELDVAVALAAGRLRGERGEFVLVEERGSRGSDLVVPDAPICHRGPKALCSVAPGADLDQARLTAADLDLCVGRPVANFKGVEDLAQVCNELYGMRFIRSHEPLPVEDKASTIRGLAIILPHGHNLVLAVNAH
mmetsp:Transcript_33216/g.96199  ORF Transcript_33216/g.96199 Transcript_33216/m.96199 type:complete len:235 (+) Transcript_33216:1022-1726(+)